LVNAGEWEVSNPMIPILMGSALEFAKSEKGKALRLAAAPSTDEFFINDLRDDFISNCFVIEYC
jgi:hypothetical protein